MATSDSPLSVPNVTLAVARQGGTSNPPPANLGAAPPGSTVIIQDDFATGVSADWSDQGQSVYLSAENAVRFDYALGIGGITYGLKKNLAAGVKGIVLDFEAKGALGPRGFKFLKVFGRNQVDNNQSYANVTFGWNYNDGVFSEVSQGSGTGLSNDTQYTIKLDGSTTGDGRGGLLNLVASSSAFNPYSDRDWHHYRLYYLLNSGDTVETEQADAKVRVEIDGVVRLQAEGFYNRNIANPREFKQFTLADYSSPNQELHVAVTNGVERPVYAQAADNSFNADGGWFRGTGPIVIGQPMDVSGMVNAANNGRFTPVSITSTKIVVQESLVDEAGSLTARLDRPLPETDLFYRNFSAWAWDGVSY